MNVLKYLSSAREIRARLAKAVRAAMSTPACKSATSWIQSRVRSTKRKISANRRLHVFSSARGSEMPVALMLAMASTVSPVGCTNNFNLTGIGSNVLTASVPNAGSNTGFNNTGAFTLSRVIKNTLDPNGTLDLIGDGAGTFANLCLPAQTGGGNNANSATSPTVCNCTFSYSNAAGSQQIDVPVTYHESNLLRCSYAGLPRDVSKVDVSVHLTSAGTYSNNISFTFSGNGVTMAATDVASYAKVNRYQCRDVVQIPYMLDGSIYDPIQSEDFHLSYPLDFYATNIANAITDYISAAAGSPDSLKFWNCPPILNPDDFMTGATLANYKSTNHLNLTVYSKAPLNGSKLIFPTQAGVFDRSTFYLSKQKTGLFNIAVDAVQSPGVKTKDGSATPSLGFGATPIPAGNGQEACPDTSATIPSGYHWVKVWLFRASLAQRHYATSSDIINTQAITCNPGTYDGTATSPVFTSCSTGGAAPSNLSTINFDSGMTSTFYLADRVLGSGQCVTFGNPLTCGASTGAGCNGADQWKVLAGSIGCGSGFLDAMGLCPVNTVKQPLTTKIGTGDLDAGSGGTGAASRYDFLFVVTPPSISLADMQDSSASSPSAPYQPYRFYSDTDCLSSDPDAPTSATDCLPSNVINTYGLKLHDVVSNGDPPATDPNRAGVFPVCALQPDSI